MNDTIGIREIGTYIPTGRISNFDKKEQFAITDKFIEEKIGVRQTSLKDESEEASDLCLKAFENLTAKTKIDAKDVDLIVVVTQNPDYNIPQTSAIVHGAIGAKEHCAAFDISLGCSGYVYALSVCLSMMKEHGFANALLFTADPYSKIIDPNDKNTSLLFGDGASVTLLGKKPLYATGKFSFGTCGKDYKELICLNGKLQMNGRAVFNFVAKQIPKDVKKLLKLNEISLSDVDRFVFHQGSRHMVEYLKKRLEIPCEKVAYDIYDYGNTISSSIPILLQDEIKNTDNQRMVISGFGVGLSWASAVLKRN